MLARMPGDGSGAAEPWFVSVEVQGRLTAARPEFAAGERLEAVGAAVLERARARGLRTAVLTRDRRAHGEDVGWLVDRWLGCDTGDAAAIAAAVRSLPGRVAAVAGCAPGTAGPAAVAARALGLRGPDPASPVVTGDAVALREALAAAGVADGRWGVVRADAPAPVSPVGYPCTVEVDGAGTRVGPVLDDGELRVLAARACCGPGTPSASHLVVGEHVPGPRYAADGHVDGGAVTVHAWSELLTTPPPHAAGLLLTATARPPSPDAAAFVGAVLPPAGTTWDRSTWSSCWGPPVPGWSHWRRGRPTPGRTPAWTRSAGWTPPASSSPACWTGPPPRGGRRSRPAPSCCSVPTPPAGSVRCRGCARSGRSPGCSSRRCSPTSAKRRSPPPAAGRTSATS
ncbi:hypothetical protein E9529_00275 [Blastococcus sp. KM273128]|uniref:hypothetical protein n=1 Tax=Blastococcus sp. KM273128 TaxID=2570314 RepID=UPI001F2C1AD1|nr:hypothetical protein [Blastococcus sp. KM273128]MCF6742729.1 hypothetical protein [Blastococcus sp. KM273128]